jgi:hypothetical protein
MLTWQVVITNQPRSTAEQVAARWSMTADQVLTSPYFLIGSPDAIVEDVQALRGRHGLSYLSVFPATSTRSRESSPNLLALNSLALHDMGSQEYLDLGRP